ncbi:MAG: flavin reductase family protein [Candidatus Thorarchaeota archaeon]|nr:MAG: flavin reductase family protein [Candidatus Thorarchaeota archaeon]
MYLLSKIEIPPRISPYPMQVVLVGATVNDKPNFLTAAWMNRLNGSPPLWGVAIGKKQYTLEGIKEHQVFSINIPSADLVEKVDYCGIVSGRNADKSKLFNIFYGKLTNAPMIGECPLAVECKVFDIVDLPSTALVLGEIVAAHTEERFLTDGKIDPLKANPFVLTMPDNSYWTLGDRLADAFQVGKRLKHDSMSD